MLVTWYLHTQDTHKLTKTNSQDSTTRPTKDVVIVNEQFTSSDEVQNEIFDWSMGQILFLWNIQSKYEGEV